MEMDSRWYDALGLRSVFDKVQAGERLSLDDGEHLFACPDINAIGALAHDVRRRRHGDCTTYVMNQHINYSNICVNGCRFCAFGRRQGEPQAFQLSVNEIKEKVREKLDQPLSEIHIVGGCHPDLPFSYYEELLRTVKELRPAATIKAFTAVEIAHFANQLRCTTREVLVRLRAAGLEMLPGGGAEIFSPRVRRLLCPEKLNGEGWLRVCGEAHELGIKTNATMLYGHVESVRERLDHLDALRRLQDQTGGVVCFIPLPFQTANTQVEGVHPSTGVDDLKTIAISRLMLDNVPHIKAYWIMLTVKLAQVALHFGADDLDGTVIEEKIGHMAGAQSDQCLSRTELERIIREAGFDPVERNCLFQPLANTSVSAPHSN